MSTADIIEGWEAPWEMPPAGTGRAESALRRLRIAGKPFLILRQRGRFQEMAYDQGRLLAREIEDGALSEIGSTIARSIDLGSDLVSTIASAVFRGVSNQVLDSVSDEFRGAAEELARGYTDGSATPRFSRQDILDASVAIEVDNLIEGISRRLQIPFVRLAMAATLARMAIRHISDPETRALVAKADEAGQQTLDDVVARMSNPNNRCNFACTGFSVPRDLTADGRHLHARNLDADLYTWNKAPVLFLMDETPGSSGWHKYVGFGTAGLLYPGGISGINDAGISASLHQLSTTTFRTAFESGRADIAPFVQQRILREAGSLSDAIDIIRDTNHFAAWTILCSDAKTGVSQRYEFNGDRIDYGPATAMPIAQTNHFLDSDLVERFFDEKDAHFTPTFGKWLESRARFAMVENALFTLSPDTPADVDWAIDLLSSGRDWTLAGTAGRLGLGTGPAVERSFGRGPRKVYGQLSTIVCGDPQRRAGGDEVWMTVGDRLPGCMSAFAGWRVDWNAFDVQPVARSPVRRTRQFDVSGRAHWEASLRQYVDARRAVARPQDENNQLLCRALGEDERRQGWFAAEQALTRAIEESSADGIVEPPYHYMRARLRHQLGDYAGAKAEWDLLRSVWANQEHLPPVEPEWPVVSPRAAQPLLHTYEAALMLLLSAVTEDNVQGNTDWSGRGGRLKEARMLLQQLKDQLFGQGTAHFDLERWIERVNDIEKQGLNAVDLPDPNFVTVE